MVDTKPSLRAPELLTCIRCQQKGMSRVEFEAGGLAISIGCGLACCGCLLCACIPCVIEDSLDCTHTCSFCGNLLGKVEA